MDVARNSLLRRNLWTATLDGHRRPMNEPRRFADRVCERLRSRYLPFQLALLAMVLGAPSLWLGWLFDDDFQRFALGQPKDSMLHRSPAELFVFIEGDEAANRQSIVIGMLPCFVLLHL